MKTKLLTLFVVGAMTGSHCLAVINIQTSYVGDAGNVNDSTGYGGVADGYHIGTYEVTNSEYTAFLNAKAATDTNNLYNSNMGSSPHGGIERSGTSGSYSYSVKSGFGNKPVNYVSFWDSARFANWLTNGQGSGDTESGVYVLTPTGISDNTVTRDATAWAGGGVAVAGEDEWYKAAFYQPVDAGGAADSYWVYPTASNSITTADANYANSVGTVTDVGTYSGDSSYYGTFDQGGNVWEWNDAIPLTSGRGLRGGSFRYAVAGGLQTIFRSYDDPNSGGNNIGFRVSSLAPIPEPSSYAAIWGCLALAIATVRRKGRGSL